MTDKAIISAYTHRSLESQRENAQGKPVFVLPDDWSQIFRPTTRNTEDRLHVDSLAILAKREDSFREFLDAAKKRKATIISKEDSQEFVVNGNCENLVKWWKDARRKNVSKIGGDLGAKAKRKAIAERAKGMTKAEWVDGSIKNAQLVAKYGPSINALKRYASDKGWGHDRQKAIWRAEAVKPKRKARSS
jgi:hypothetical protein